MNKKYASFFNNKIVVKLLWSKMFWNQFGSWRCGKVMNFRHVTAPIIFLQQHSLLCYIPYMIKSHPLWVQKYFHGKAIQAIHATIPTVFSKNKTSKKIRIWASNCTTTAGVWSPVGSAWSDTESHLSGGDRWKRVDVCMLWNRDRRILGFSPLPLPGAHWLISTVQMMSWCASWKKIRNLALCWNETLKHSRSCCPLCFSMKLNVLCTTQCQHTFGCFMSHLFITKENLGFFFYCNYSYKQLYKALLIPVPCF